MITSSAVRARELSPSERTAEAVETPKLQVALFSGGRGAHTICESLLNHPQIALTVLINAYDDGHSTGRIRRFIRGMLGPSDVRKNIDRLMPSGGRNYKALQFVSNYRLPVGMEHDAGLHLVAELAAGRYTSLPDPVRAEFENLTIAQAAGLYSYFHYFYLYSLDELNAGRRFDYSDCALGNIIFAGCFLREQRDFNRAVAALSQYYELRAGLLNITIGENLFLVARKEDGTVLRGEADIVSAQNPARISELWLIDENTYRDHVESSSLDDEELARVLAARHIMPRVNPEAVRMLSSADVMIYGPGTQHSSLLPSYLTSGLAETIAGNKSADKLFICNIRRDHDLPREDAMEVLAKFYRAMSRDGELDLGWRDTTTHFFFQQRSEEQDDQAQYIPFNPQMFRFPEETLRLRDWESADGRHSGGSVLEELHQLVQRRLDIVLQPSRRLVSIIVPVYNEAATLEAALRDLVSLPLSGGLSKEIIVVDGGSTDGSCTIAASVPGIRALRMDKNRGRGAAMRRGLEVAQGDTVVFFPADREYQTSDIERVVTAVLRNEFQAVFGTRNVKCTDLSARLSHIYGNAHGLYLMSKYGGMLLSMATLLCYNRYVSDPLTCLMAFDSRLLRSLNLRSDGLDIQTEIVAKLCKAQHYILELPVDYQPRTRAKGKKTTPMDGFRALVPLLREKYTAGRE
jgi:2-phospho-L-lactate transferase/gluconeogenesis factor (CofD/UPF0052 family)